MCLSVEKWTKDHPYETVSRRQEELIRRRQEAVLICEHPPTVTLGTRAVQEDLLFPPEQYGKRGITVFKAPRGGQTTYHGPGQLVVYPVLHLKSREIKIRDYLRLLEAAMMRVCDEYGVRAHVICGKTGLWVENRKIGFIGVRVRHGFAFHGFSLNILPQQDPFRLIVPCGMPNQAVTSLQEETRRSLEVWEVGSLAVQVLQDTLLKLPKPIHPVYST